MARATYIKPNVKEWLKKFKFCSKIKVRYSETDMSGHINNVSYFIYFEQARGEYLNSINFFDSQVTAVTADLWCHYHQEAFFPDNLKAGVRVVGIGSKTMDLEYYIISEDESLIATARGTLVIIDKKTNRSMTIPKEIQESIRIIEGLELVTK